MLLRCHDNLAEIHRYLLAYADKFDSVPRDSHHRFSVELLGEHRRGRLGCPSAADGRLGYVSFPHLHIDMLRDPETVYVVACDEPGNHPRRLPGNHPKERDWESVSFLLSDGRVLMVAVDSEKFEGWVEQLKSDGIEAGEWPPDVFKEEKR